MRTLKFRAWHKEYGMIHPNEYFSLQDALHGLIDFFGSPAKDYGTKDFTFMQFTGLLDKHGKEVHEGDIVRATLVENPGQAIQEVTEVVSIHEGLLAPFYMRVNFEEDWWKDALQDGFEIIGNVHETPELLGDALPSSRRQVGEY